MEVNQSDTQEYRKIFQETYNNNNFSFEDSNSPFGSSRKNSINISYYFPGKNSFEEKDNNALTNVNVKYYKIRT